MALGFGASYPIRNGSPNSQQVGYLPNARDWAADWQNRWNAVEAMPTTTTQLVQGSDDYSASAAEPWLGEVAQTNRDTILRQAGVDPANADWFDDSGIDWLGGTAYDGTGQGSHTVTSAPTITTQSNDAASAARQALMDEKERMTPLLENQTRQQQSYDGMRGWGQENGVMGANYSQPGFGQVNGDFGQDKMGNNPATGIDMSFADGAYQPQNAGSGVYSPTGAKQNKTWGLW